MTTRWIVERDGRGGVAVAEDTGSGGRIVKDDLTRDKAERLIAKLRERDAQRLHSQRVEAGHRLAKHQAREES